MTIRRKALSITPPPWEFRRSRNLSHRNRHQTPYRISGKPPLTPFGETPPRGRFAQEGRLLAERCWGFYNGYNITYQPRRMTAGELEEAYRSLWSRVFSPSRVTRRILRGKMTLDASCLALSTLMNDYYGLKRLRGTGPITPESDNGIQAQPGFRLSPE